MGDNVLRSLEAVCDCNPLVTEEVDPADFAQLSEFAKVVFDEVEIFEELLKGISIGDLTGGG